MADALIARPESPDSRGSAGPAGPVGAGDGASPGGPPLLPPATPGSDAGGSRPISPDQRLPDPRTGGLGGVAFLPSLAPRLTAEHAHGGGGGGATPPPTAASASSSSSAASSSSSAPAALPPAGPGRASSAALAPPTPQQTPPSTAASSVTAPQHRPGSSALSATITGAGNSEVFPDVQLFPTSGSRFYGRTRLVLAEELVAAAPMLTGSGVKDRRLQLARSRRRTKTPGSAAASARDRYAESSRASSRAGSRAASRAGHRRGRPKDNGESDTYDAYPWSRYFRDEVMVLSKMPKPPYFRQLAPGLRPDTVVLRCIPVGWFLDTPEEVAAEREREFRESKVVQFGTVPGGAGSPGGGRGGGGGGDGGEGDHDREPESDSPIWFTKHGKILIKAACMRFGPVRRVDLVFEMESRNEEWTLMFDAYIQFKTFAGFRDAFIAFDGGVLLHDADMRTVALEPEFDTTGYFSDHNVQLRKVRRELAKRKEEQEERALRVAAKRARQLYRDELSKIHKVVKKLTNDLEDADIALDKLLAMGSAEEEEEMQGGGGAGATTATGSSGWGRPESRASAVSRASTARPGTRSSRPGSSSSSNSRPGSSSSSVGRPNTRGQLSTRGSSRGSSRPRSRQEQREDEGFIRAVEEARRCQEEVQAYIALLPERNDGPFPATAPGAEAGMQAEEDEQEGTAAPAPPASGLDMLPRARRLLGQWKKAITHAASSVFKAHTIRTVQVPSLLKVLREHGATTRMATLVEARMRTHGPAVFHGVTLLVPHDRSFGYETVFTEDCWGTHIVNGPYDMRTLHDLATMGPGRLLCGNMENSLSVGINEVGEFTVWVERLGHPRRVVRVEQPDVSVQHGTMVHFVDKVMFPPSY